MKIKNENAITLIALVVTIVILLILSGVSINLVVGNNGIINKANVARDKTSISKVKEKIEMDLANTKINNLGEISEEEFYNVLNKYGNIVQDENGNEILKINKTELSILVEELKNGEIIGERNPNMFKFDASKGIILGIKDEYLQNVENSNNALLLKKEIKTLIVPNEINGVPVKTIKNIGVENVDKIVIEDGIEKINRILNHSHKVGITPKLKEVILPNTLLEFGRNAFYGCANLKKIELPESLIKLGSGTFKGCGLTDIKIPKNVSEFYYGMTDLNIFEDCYNLKNIFVDPENSVFSSENGILYNKEKTKIIVYPAGKDEIKFNVPSNVKEIANSAFCSSKIKEIFIPESVMKIDEIPFYKSKIEKVIVDDKNLNYSTNQGVLYNKIKSELLFYPECKKEIEYTVPETVKTLKGLRYNNYVETINLPANLSNCIGIKSDTSFMDCMNLKNINIDSSNPYYTSENGILYNKDKTELIRFAPNRPEINFKIPGTIKKLRKNTFEGCKNLKNLTIEEGVISLGDFPFWKASGLESVDIPSTINSIPADAFYECDNLKKITINKPENSISGKPWNANNATIEWIGIKQ